MAAMDLISIMLANFSVLLMTLVSWAVAVAALTAAVAVVVGAVKSIELAPPTFADSMYSWQHRLPISHHCGIRPPIQSFREVCNCHRYPTHGFRKIVAAREKVKFNFVHLIQFLRLAAHLPIFVGYVFSTSSFAAQHALRTMSSKEFDGIEASALGRNKYGWIDATSSASFGDCSRRFFLPSMMNMLRTKKITRTVRVMRPCVRCWKNE